MSDLGDRPRRAEEVTIEFERFEEHLSEVDTSRCPRVGPVRLLVRRAERQLPKPLLIVISKRTGEAAPTFPLGEEQRGCYHSFGQNRELWSTPAAPYHESP